MKCLKCGQKVSTEQFFCESCLKDMERHPVDPGTPVMIPTRSKPLPVKRNHKRMLLPDEIIAKQKKSIRRLCTLLILTALLAIAAIAAACYLYFAGDFTPPAIPTDWIKSFT